MVLERNPYAAPRSATDPYQVSCWRISASSWEPMSILSALKTPGRVSRFVFLMGAGVLRLAHLLVVIWLCSAEHWKMRHFALEVVSTEEKAWVMSRLRRDAPVLLGMIDIHVPPGLRCWM